MPEHIVETHRTLGSDEALGRLLKEADTARLPKHIHQELWSNSPASDRLENIHDSLGFLFGSATAGQLRNALEILTHSELLPLPEGIPLALALKNRLRRLEEK